MRRNAASGSQARIDVNVDLATCTPVRSGSRESRNDEEPDSNEIERVIKKRLFGEGFARDRQLRDGNVRRVEWKNCRGSDAWRHDSKQSLANRRDLRDRGTDVGSRLKVCADIGNTRYRLRLETRNSLHGRGKCPLINRRNASFHFFSGESRIVPNNTDHRNIDDRKDVDEHR